MGGTNTTKSPQIAFFFTDPKSLYAILTIAHKVGIKRMRNMASQTERLKAAFPPEIAQICKKRTVRSQTSTPSGLLICLNLLGNDKKELVPLFFGGVTHDATMYLYDVLDKVEAVAGSFRYSSMRKTEPLFKNLR